MTTTHAFFPFNIDASCLHGLLKGFLPSFRFHPSCLAHCFSASCILAFSSCLLAFCSCCPSCLPTLLSWKSRRLLLSSYSFLSPEISFSSPIPRTGKDTPNSHPSASLSRLGPRLPVAPCTQYRKTASSCLKLTTSGIATLAWHLVLHGCFDLREPVSL